MIIIIGAGAAGNYTAYLLAKQGFDVEVIEANETIGLPVACTGILTSHFDTLIEPKKEIIANEVPTSRIHAPNKEYVEVNFKKPNKILNRDMLDQHVARIAMGEGAKYRLGSIYMENKKTEDGQKVKIKNLKTEEIIETETSLLIGADGPASRVAKNNGMYGNRTLYTGLQATAKMDNENIIDFYPDQRGIAWIVPESKNKVRIGIACQNLKDANVYFESFCREKLGEDYKEKIMAKQAGPIPLHDPKVKTKNGNVLITGDAATMVKATTLGGIMQSHLAAKALARSITERKNYEKEWRKEIGRDLWMHLIIRKAMDKFSEKDYNELVRIFKKEKNKKILEEHDRDFPTKFLSKLIIQEPKLALFSRFLI